MPDTVTVKQAGKTGLEGTALREQILGKPLPPSAVHPSTFHDADPIAADNAKHLYKITFPDPVPELRLVIEKSDLRPFMASVWYDRGEIMHAPGLMLVCGYPGQETVTAALEDLLICSIERIAEKMKQNHAKGLI